MTNPLSISKLHKSYGNRIILSDINFSLVQGEIFGLIGLNGEGKTTLIKTILDLTKADSGEITICDLPSSEIEARKNLSYLPEKFQPSRYLKGFEYLDLVMSYYGKNLDKEAAIQKVSALDLCPDALVAMVRSYSKGMGQKLGLASAFLVDTPLIILDEPMSGLDPRARIKLKGELLASKQAGKTVFFSSHILSDIDEVCDRIGIIHDGRLRFVGTPEAFKESQQESSLEKAFLKIVEIHNS